MITKYISGTETRIRKCLLLETPCTSSSHASLLQMEPGGDVIRSAVGRSRGARSGRDLVRRLLRLLRITLRCHGVQQTSPEADGSEKAIV